MIHIVFTDATGIERTVSAQVGQTLMQTAKNHQVPGIDAECGGCSACATCGVFIDPTWFAAVGPAGEIEASMLECCRANGPQSRLACQVVLTEAMDGLRVRTPDRQQ